MTNLFLKLVNMSITASWLVGAVVLLRLLLKKAPKAIHCCLWALVAIRLVCPFTLESSISLVPRQTPITVQTFQPEAIAPSPSVEYGIIRQESPTGELSPAPVMAVNHLDTPFSAILPDYLSAIWLAGLCFLLIYAAESWLRIRQRVIPSIQIGSDLWICDHIDTPFILGIVRPRIYIPSILASQDTNYVLAHERTHLKRKDHWWKPFGFLLLSVYWFNPVIWIAYCLLCRDIEMACDENVIRNMDIAEKKAYSTALLNCSLPRHRIAACPLAFGEVGVRNRVKKVLHYRKPPFRTILIAAVLCLLSAICLLTNPASRLYLYEIDDSRNYSDLFINTDAVFLVKEGEQYSVPHPDGVLNLLDDITVREHPVNRSREETRDKTHQVHIRGNTYLNFSWNFTHIWIDNGVKPTHTYRVNEPEVLRALFAIITGEKLSITALDVTPTGLTAVFSPKKVYDSEDHILEGNYWLEYWNGRQWKPLEPLKPEIPRHIHSAILLSDPERHIVDWSVIHGPLSAGKYRIGRTIVFMDIFKDSGIAHDLYAEFAIAKNASTWFQSPLDAAHDSPLEDSSAHLPGAEHITLHHSYEDHQITIEADGKIERIISGWPIFGAYFYDLTGDGVDEVCTTVAEGFGLIDIRVRVYDCMEKTLYELEDRGNSNYVLSVRSNQLAVTQTRTDHYEVLNEGLLSLSDDGTSLMIIPRDNSAG